MGQCFRKRMPQMAAIDREVLDPLPGQIGVNLGPSRHRRVDVAVDHPQLRCSGLVAVEFDDAHAPISMGRSTFASRGYVANAFSLVILLKSALESFSGNTASPSNCQCG